MAGKVTPEMIKELRDITGVPVGKCKEALEATQGNKEEAIKHLRMAGMATAVKKGGRETKEGVIKVSDDNSALALVEVNAETDFVVKNEKFQTFADSLVIDAKKGAPTTLEAFLAQKYSKDPSMTIEEFRVQLVQLLGENIQVRRVELFPKKKGQSIGYYSHLGGKLVTLVVLEGEGEEALAKDIAMHIASEAPEYLQSDEVPARIVEHEKEIARSQIKGKPAEIQEKIVQGKLKAYYDQVCLLSQKFIKDPSISIAELVEKRSKETKKPLKIVQFLRWKVGD